MSNSNNLPTGEGKFALPSGLYDVAKDTATLYLPALGTLYFTIAQIWGLPYAEQVVGTVVALSTFLGVVLKVSNVSYNNSTKSIDGVLEVDQSDLTKDNFLIDLSMTDLDEVANMDKIVLKVNNQTDAKLSSMDPRNVTRKDSQN